MEHIDEQLQAWLDGELSNEEAGRLEEHCRQCPQCAQQRTAMQAVMDVLEQDATQAREASSLWPGVHQRLAQRPRVRLGAALGFSLAAATAGLVVGILLQPAPAVSDPWAAAHDWATDSRLVADNDATLDDWYLAASFGEEGE